MKSILFSDEDLQQAAYQEQFEYVALRNQELQKLEKLTQAQKISLNSLPFLQLKKETHEKLVGQLRLLEFEELKRLDPNSFTTLFDDPPVKDSEMINQCLKEQYFKDYVLKPQMEEEQQKMSRYVKVCGLAAKPENNVTNKERKIHAQEMEQLRREINQIQKELQPPHVLPSKELCRNAHIIGKMSGPLLSMFNIYFPEIFDALIDELLLDEVAYLNEQERVQEQALAKPQAVASSPLKSEEKSEGGLEDSEVKDMMLGLQKLILETYDEY